MADIKSRFVLEGEQQFRSAMSSATAAIKVLNSEQKLAKAQFQNTGNAEKYAADQARILKEKIEQQKIAVKAAEQALKQMNDNGVSKSTKQYQQWQTKLNDAQTALTKMETELKSVNSTMEVTTGNATEAGNAISSIGKNVSFEAVAGGIGKITDKMAAAAQTAKELATGLINTMRDSAAWADDLATTATVYGISQEELQRMQYTADLLDTSVESIMKSRQKLITNMVYGNKEVQETFEELGVATRELVNPAHGDGLVSGGYRDWADVFWEAGEALMKMGDYEKASAAATKIFGRSWAELLPLFNNDWAEKGYKSAREYYEATMDSWDVVSDENVAKLTKLDDAMQTLENNFTTLKETVISELAPAFTGVTETISKLMVEFNKYLQTDEGKKKLQDLSDAVTKLFSGLTNVDFGAALDLAKNALDTLVNGLIWLSEPGNLESVKHTLETLALLFGGLKIAEGVLTFLQLLSAGKFLLGGVSAAEAAAAGTAAGTAWGGAFASAVMKAAPWLAFAYELLNPAATASNDLDVPFDEKSGRLTTAGWDDYKASMQRFAETGERDDWVDAMFAVGELFEDLPSIASNFEAVNAIAKFRMGGSQDTESLISTLQALGFTKKTTDAELGNVQLDSNSVQINTDGAITDENGNRVGFDLKSTNGKTVHKDRRTGKVIEDEPVEVPADVVVPDGTPESILKQIGQVVLPVRLQVLGGGLLSTLLSTMQNLSFFSHANGIWSVPWDGYPAILHRNERVIPANQSKNYTYNSHNYFGNVSLNNGLEIDDLTRRIDKANRRKRNGFGE